MRYKCSKCGVVMIQDEGTVPQSCSSCGARFRPPAELMHSQPTTDMVPAMPPGYPAPIVVQVNAPSDPFEYIEEKIADLRERREVRQVERQYRREDRLSNPLGIAGFAVVGTTFLLLLSAWLFAKSLPAYLYIAAALAIPASLTGLILSVVGVLLKGRPKEIALCGVILGAPLVLFMVPMSFLLRDWLAP
jgi:uncharacterized Zn finger protein (UPF0148 family)